MPQSTSKFSLAEVNQIGKDYLKNYPANALYSSVHTYQNQARQLAHFPDQFNCWENWLKLISIYQKLQRGNLSTTIECYFREKFTHPNDQFTLTDPSMRIILTPKEIANQMKAILNKYIAKNFFEMQQIERPNQMRPTR
jgi:hypothetical protein